MIPILEKRSFDFTMAHRGSTVVVLCPAVCVLAYTRVQLSVRVHDLTMSSGQSVVAVAQNTLPSDEDPAQDFDESVTVSTASITASPGAPLLVTGSTGHDPVAYVKISLFAFENNISPPPFRATLSACLLLRAG